MYRSGEGVEKDEERSQALGSKVIAGLKLLANQGVGRGSTVGLQIFYATDDDNAPSLYKTNHHGFCLLLIKGP
jgi:CRISPR/Cas system CSM-associated protein Csm4 (group 5 of RAMP superfamily)